jgi:hypothetical protein
VSGFDNPYTPGPPPQASRRVITCCCDDPPTEATDTPRRLPPKIAVDAEGFYWRDFSDGSPPMWSMCPTNPDNSPIAEPVTFYVPEASRDESRATALSWKTEATALRDEVEGLRAALRFYAEQDNYFAPHRRKPGQANLIGQDLGARARAALDSPHAETAP